MLKTVVEERCPICGQQARFQIDEGAALLREAGCEHCGVSLRTADVVECLLKRMQEEPLQTTLGEAARKHTGLQVLNMFSEGPIHAAFKGLPGYRFGEYFDGVPSGDSKDGVLCIDLQNIPFAENRFDFVITEDVLEHVGDSQQAFAEIARVLKPGGWHIFTVPVHEGHRTQHRDADHPVYHGDPLREQGAMVVTDFGDDLPELLQAVGMDTEVTEAHRFYSPQEVCWLDDEKDYAVYLQNRDNLLRAFRYNSFVFAAQKRKAGVLSRLYHQVMNIME